MRHWRWFPLVCTVLLCGCGGNAENRITAARSVPQETACTEQTTVSETTAVTADSRATASAHTETVSRTQTAASVQTHTETTLTAPEETAPVSAQTSRSGTAPPEPVTTVTEPTTLTEATTTTAPVIPLPEPIAAFSDAYGTYDYSQYADLLANTVFVGDSIIYAMEVHGILPPAQIIAKGGLGVRDALDTVFTVDGSEWDVITALITLQPQYVVCSFGLNDIRLESQEEFLGNYHTLLCYIQDSLPEAQIFVASITPITNDNPWSTNEYIDSYNTALSGFLAEHPEWTFLDIAPELKNAENGLKSGYHNGDGMHLMPEAYAPFLWQILAGMRHAIPG